MLPYILSDFECKFWYLNSKTSEWSVQRNGMQGCEGRHAGQADSGKLLLIAIANGSWQANKNFQQQEQHQVDCSRVVSWGQEKRVELANQPISKAAICRATALTPVTVSTEEKWRQKAACSPRAGAPILRHMVMAAQPIWRFRQVNDWKDPFRRAPCQKLLQGETMHPCATYYSLYYIQTIIFTLYISLLNNVIIFYHFFGH